MILFTKRSGRGAEPNACPHLCQENPARKQGVAYMACHKRVACVDISPASVFPWRCVTGHDTCSKEWGGGKVSRRILLFESAPQPPPQSIVHTRTFILNLGSDMLRAPIFSFLWARWCNVCKDSFLGEGLLVAGRPPSPGVRLVHVLKQTRPAPQASAFSFSIDGGRENLRKLASTECFRFGEELVTSAPPAWGLESPDLASQFSPGSGALYWA